MSSKYVLIKQHLLSFLKHEVGKTGLDNVVLGLSGGIDSAVVALLAKEAFGKKCLSVMLPSTYSSNESIFDAKELCMKFDIAYKIIPINPFVDAYLSSIEKKPSSLDMGNFCARIRMNILYDLSAKQKALVIGTSNKTELLLGYGTLFGDLSSALNPIGDLYKSEIFEFAEFLGVNESIVNKTPSADLYEGQSDEEDLGYSYSQIDSFLIDMVDNRYCIDELELKYDTQMVYSLSKRVFTNQFKRTMPIIAKISNRTIGHDFLYPRDIHL